jgi:hypothetical protein
MKRSAIVFAGILLVSGVAVAGEPKIPGKKAGLPKVSAVDKGPAVNGDISDPVWKQALPLKFGGYCDAERRKKGEKPKDATEVKLLTDRENLYISFRCAESHSDGPWVYENARFKRRYNSHVMGGDYVAVALDMGRWGLYNYYMFFVNAKGELYKCFTWPVRYDLVLQKIGLPAAVAATRIDKAGKSWTAELKIPLKDLLRHPADGFPKIVGLDLRRVQWGKERGTAKFSIYWTGMANVVGNRIKPQYDHMATWKSLFETYPNYRYSYCTSRGWVQLIFPESFGHVELEVGEIDNKLISGKGARLYGLAGTRTSWHKPKEMRARAYKAFDAPRMEYWADLRSKHPAGEPRVMLAKPVRKPGGVATFETKPAVSKAGDSVKITFKASAPTDVAVAVLDGKGRIVRHLVAGVLGDNPPKPLKPGLKQALVWDHKDDDGKPVKPGAYKVRVSLGLNPRFHHAIDLKKAWVHHDKWPKGLDVENLPEPLDPKKAWPSNHSGYSGGKVNYLAVDRQRDEVYVQQRYVFDGETGKMLRDFKTRKKMPTQSRGRAVSNGEIFVGPDELVYVGGSNEIWRFDRQGKPAPFPALGRHFIPELWGAHSNPHRGICVGPDGDVYKVHHYVPHSSPQNQVTRIGSDGRIKDFGFIEIRTSAAGVRVDRQGNVYVGCTVQPPGALPPKDWAAKLPKYLRDKHRRLYGSIVKFGPAGGIIKPDPQGKLACPGARGMRSYTAQGALWVHPGFSPMLSRIPDKRGGPGCSCRNGRFDLDDFGRLFIPDAVQGRVEVVDSNGNTILFFGRRGKPDKSGVELGWGSQVAVSDRACYVADYLRYRVLRVKLGYVAKEKVAVNVP